MNHSRAHHSDDSDIGRILQSGHTGEVRSRIGTPIAAKTHDQRFKSVAHQPAPKAAFTCAASCSRVKPLTKTPFFGQVAIQHPPPLQAVSSTRTVFFTAPLLM